MSVLDVVGASGATFEERCASGRCRVCRQQTLRPVLDLGLMPPSDRFQTAAQLEQTREPRFPLDVAFCETCALVQILETVDPSLLFGSDYVYRSSFSDTLRERARHYAGQLIQQRGLGPDSLVMEAGSNDGTLLRNFVAAGVPVLGVDPAPTPVAAAREAGVETLCDFFTVELARRLAAEGRQADVMIGNNVLAHVADTNGFAAGVKAILKPGGIGSFEFPYVVDLVEHCEFDTIYHEHLCYFSLSAVDQLFRRHELYLQDVERLAIHGGSLRVHVGHADRPARRVTELLEHERRTGVDGLAFFADFARRARDVADRLKRMIGELRGAGKRVAAYGAAAKGTIMLNFSGLGPDELDFVADRNTHKHGKLTPGTHIPICGPEALLERKPDHVLLLVWNFKDEVLAQQQAYRDAGGRFIIPIPTPEIV